MVKVLVLHCSWSGPATAAEGGSWLIRSMSSELGVHPPLLIVQRNVAVVPTGTPVIVVVGEVGFVIVAVPDTTVQAPVPTTGVLALITNVLLSHCSISTGPASAVVGSARLVRTTWSTLAAQVPFSTRHSRVADVPAGTPVTVVLKAPGVVIVAVPDTKLHVPLPIAGSTAVIVKLPSLQFSLSKPASAVDGSSWLIRSMSSKLGVHPPLLIVQRNVAVVPTGTPVIVVVGDVGFVIVAVPDTTVQVPVPTPGVLALITNVLLSHCSISTGPASAVVGSARLVRTTWSTLAAQVPFSTRHSRVAEVPTGTPVTGVLKAFGLVMLAVPDTKLHVPLPIAGSTAVIVKLPSLQFSLSKPASAVDGGSWLIRSMSSKLGVHPPLLIVQRNVAVVPTGTPVIVVVGDVGLVIVAVPETTVQ